MPRNEVETGGGGGILRRLDALEKSNEDLAAEVSRLREAVNTVGNRILYAVAAGALAFAFSVLQLVG